MLLDVENLIPTRLTCNLNVAPIALTMMLSKILGENTELSILKCVFMIVVIGAPPGMPEQTSGVSKQGSSGGIVAQYENYMLEAEIKNLRKDISTNNKKVEEYDKLKKEYDKVKKALLLERFVPHNVILNFMYIVAILINLRFAQHYLIIIVNLI